MDVTLQQHVIRAAKLAAVLKKHGADITDLADDAPKLIAIAGDLHAAFKEEDIQVSTAAAMATAPRPLEQLPPKITAKQAAAHVEKHGLDEQERVIFDRETQTFG